MAKRTESRRQRGWTANAIRLAAALCVSMLPQAAFAQNPGVSSDSIVLGQSAPLTGSSAQLGLQMRDGIRLYLDHVNSRGGINGRKIELKTYDDKNDPSQCVENTKKLIQEDKIFALIGYVGSAPVTAALPIVTEAKVPLIGPAAGDEVLYTPLNRYVFNVRASYAQETDRIIEHLVLTGNNKIAVFYQDDSYGQAGLAGSSESMTRRSSFIFSAASVERNSLNVGAAVKSIAPTKPDTVLVISAYQPTAAFVREMRKAGYTGSFYTLSSVGSQALADELGAEGKGVAVSQIVPFPWSEAIPVVGEFAKLAKTAGNVDVNFSSLEGFIAAKIMVEGLKRAGKNLTRTGLISALESAKVFDVGGMKVEYSPTSHGGSKFVELTLISRGKFVK